MNQSSQNKLFALWQNLTYSTRYFSDPLLGVRFNYGCIVTPLKDTKLLHWICITDCLSTESYPCLGTSCSPRLLEYFWTCFARFRLRLSQVYSCNSFSLALFFYLVSFKQFWYIQSNFFLISKVFIAASWISFVSSNHFVSKLVPWFIFPKQIYEKIQFVKKYKIKNFIKKQLTPVFIIATVQDVWEGTEN